MPKLRICLKHIIENDFTKNDEVLTDTSKVLYPQMGFNLLTDVKTNLLTVATQVGFATSEGEKAVTLNFQFILEVISLSSLECTYSPENGTSEYRFPEGFLEAVLTDVYATARILLAQKLVGTRLERTYLPFIGAGNLTGMIKKH